MNLEVSNKDLKVVLDKLTSTNYQKPTVELLDECINDIDYLHDIKCMKHTKPEQRDSLI